jgi:quercetin dioxygenase-like cupin family protein
MIKFENISSVKIVSKPWGYEKWIASGKPNFKYALKEIFIKKGTKTSLQFHEFKEETVLVTKGTAALHYSDEKIDLAKFKLNKYIGEELEKKIKSLKIKKIHEGSVFHIKALFLHRLEALTDLTIIEASTIEVDDVYRLQDDTNRQSGKIDSEHK